MNKTIDSTIKLRDTVRGKKTRFFDAQGVDELVSISMALAQELWVVRERQIAFEEALARKGIAFDAEALELSAEARAQLDAERATFIDRIFFVLRENAESLDDGLEAVPDPPEP